MLQKLHKIKLNVVTSVVEIQEKNRQENNQEKIYCDKMKEYLFDTFKILDEDSDGKLKAVVPYYFLSSVALNSELSRSKRIAQEMVTLSTALPLSSSSSIFVRFDEERIDVMKVIITGPSETPYSSGCFEFDVSFPINYPIEPPKVLLKTTGNSKVRFNPNLYNCGKVCLSILNTWYARPEEKWNSETSTLLQV